jgi:hypothetical protein
LKRGQIDKGLAISTSVVFQLPGVCWYTGKGRVGTSRTARTFVILRSLF